MVVEHGARPKGFHFSPQAQDFETIDGVDLTSRVCLHDHDVRLE